MEFIVYSYGGADILWKVLNSMAMIGNSGVMRRLGVLMMGVGILTVAARAIPAASFPLLFRRWILPMFALMGFFWGPKVTVDLVDNVNPQFRAARVDNVPFGIALGASLSTSLSKTLTEIVETVVASSDMERSSQTGPLFAARLMYEARTLTIKDPLMRENIKDFTRQCFAWPFIFTNIRPGKKAAMESQDMLGFIEENAHKALGMYWRQPDGQSRFMFCAQCAAKVREVLPLETRSGWRSLAGKLFGPTEDGVAETARLQQYFGDAWQYLAKGSSDAAQAIQQELMLNAYRAALQDKREEFGLARNPTLSYLNAERGQLQQDESFLVKAALSGMQIPNLHGFLMGFALIVLAIMAPFTLMEGGYRMVFTFAKIMLWLATWPPLFAILNCMGYMYLGKSASAQLMGYGEGLNLMTQNGLADMAYHTYAFIMGLQYSVPFVSWAMLSSGGGYALAQFSSFLTQSGESFAGKVAAEVVDGNVTFDSQTLHYRSVANTQLAQQQIGPNVNSGARFDDGTFAKTYGITKDGEWDRTATFQQHLNQLAINTAQNDTMNAVMALGSAMSYSAGLTNSKRAGEQAQIGLQKMFTAMESLSHVEGLSNSFGRSENSNVSKSLNNVIGQVQKFALDNKISESDSFQIHFGGGLSISPDLMKAVTKGGIGGLLGGLNAEVRANHQTLGQKHDDLSKQISTDQAKSFGDNLANVINFMDDHKGSISDSSVVQSIAQSQQSLHKSQIYSEEASANFQQQKTFNESANISRQKGFSTTSNLNESILSHVAVKRFGGDMGAAVAWQAKHPDLYRKEAAGFLDSSQPTSLYSKESIEADHKHNIQKIEEAPMDSQSLESSVQQLKQSQEKFLEEVKDHKNWSEGQHQFINSAIDKKPELEKAYKDIEDKHAAENKKSTIGRAGKRLIS